MYKYRSLNLRNSQNSMMDKDKENDNGLEEEGSSDAVLWRQVTRDVTPLEGRNETALPTHEPEEHTAKPRTRKDDVASQGAGERYVPVAPKSSEVDRRTAQRLQRGQIPIEGRLDLHGMTQNEAYDALLGFIPAVHAQRKRCVLVITGKGGRQDSGMSLLDTRAGILRQKTPEWLGIPPLQRYVLRIQAARPHHGGDGALYILLRRS